MFDHLIKDDFSGVVRITQNSKCLFTKACGLADWVHDVPNETDTRFGTASAGKVFVAVAILQLIEKNKIQLNTTIGEIFDFPLFKIDPLITVEQLLNHTSGIPDYFDEEIMEDYSELWVNTPNYRIRASNDLLPLFIEKPMMYPKGEKFQYNNSGYVMLGLIIEAVTGISFDAYIEQHIFKSAGMSLSGYFELDRLPKKCANAYIYDEETKGYYTNIYSIDAKGSGAGGAFLTAEDVEKFWRALLNDQLLSQELRKEMLSYQSGNDDEHYGYGVWLTKNTNAPFFQGCDPGIAFISRYHSETNSVVTILSNNESNVWTMARAFEALLKNNKG